MLKEIYSSVNEAIQVETDKNIKLKRRIKGSQVSIKFIFEKKGKKQKYYLIVTIRFISKIFLLCVFIVSVVYYHCSGNRFCFSYLIYPRVKVIIYKNYNIS